MQNIYGVRRVTTPFSHDRMKPLILLDGSMSASVWFVSTYSSTAGWNSRSYPGKLRSSSHVLFSIAANYRPPAQSRTVITVARD